MARTAALAVALAGATTAAAQEVPLIEGLGTYEHRISTTNPQAQQYFNQGIRLTWAFNHVEAIGRGGDFVPFVTDHVARLNGMDMEEEVKKG